MNGANVGAGLQATSTGTAGSAARPAFDREQKDRLPAGSSKQPTDHAPGGVTLQFHIDRVTLPAMSRADTTRVVDAMKKGLAKLANKSPGRDWPGLSAIDRLDGGALQAGARPEQIGEHLAAQIFRRLSS